MASDVFMQPFVELRLRLVTLAALAALALSSVGCGASSQTKPTPTPVEQRQPATLDPRVAPYLLGEHIPFVVKVRGDKLGELDSVAKRLSAINAVPPAMRSFGAKVDEEGLAALLAVYLPKLEVDGVAGERSAYAMHRMMASDAYWSALGYGAVLQPLDVVPRAHHMRVLLPTDSPGEIVKTLQKRLRFPVARGVMAAATAMERFVRVDIVSVRGGLSMREVLTDAVAYRGEAESLRPTPASSRFATSDAPVAVHMRSEQMRRYLAAKTFLDGLNELVTAPPQRRQLILARSSSLALNILASSPQSEREAEDAVIEIRSADAGALIVDGFATSTALGREVTRLAGTKRVLTDVPRASGESLQRFGSLRFNYDFERANAELPVSLGAGVDPSKAPSLPSAASLLRGLSGGASARMMTLIMVASPLAIPRLAATLAPESVNPALPKAGALEFAVSTETSAPGNLIGIFGRLIFASPAASEVLAGPIRQLRAMYAAVEWRDQAEFEARGDGTGALELRMGPGNESAGGEELALEPGVFAAQVDLAAAAAMAGNGRPAKQLGPLSSLDAQLRLEPTVHRFRLQLGSGKLAAPAVPEVAGFEPVETPHACVDHLVLASIRALKNMEGISGETPVDQILAVLDEYDKMAQACAEREPELADTLELARARMRGMLLWSLMSRDRPEATRAVRKSACELGDAIQCKMLETNTP